LNKGDIKHDLKFYSVKNGNAEKVNKFSSKIYNNCDEKKMR